MSFSGTKQPFSFKKSLSVFKIMVSPGIPVEPISNSSEKTTKEWRLFCRKKEGQIFERFENKSKWGNSLSVGAKC